ncbi:MAG: hypothetical protein AC479_04325 [miscellaneous Crenarchaeota group-6 archaeon AD8-1]|nr:MAG: hypothetical protein AC479_04325 [miscellaneous Crenarchaeota group-6 archaeon AD8-1]
MALKLLQFGTGIAPKKLFVITILNSSLLAWYFFLAQVNFEIIFRNFSDSTSIIYTGQALFYFFGAISAIIGAGIGSRFKRKKILFILTTLGVISSFSLLFFQSEISIFFLCPILGITLGLVYPVSMSMMADSSKIEDRGKVAGIYILQTFVMLAIFIILQEMLELGFFGIIVLLVIIRSISFLPLVIEDSKSTKMVSEKLKKNLSWSFIVSHRQFVLYFIPWLIFLIVTVIADHILWPSFPDTQEIVEAMAAAEPMQYVGTAIFSIVSGILADRIGRKYPIIIGLIWLGVSFALLTLTISNLTVFLHVMAIGIAFGFLMVIYTAIPADLSDRWPKSRERFYALIVVLPLSAYGAVGAIPAIFGINAAPNIIAPFLGVILFLSIIPIMAVKETLPRSKMERRKYKTHIEKLGELREEME